MDTNCIISNSTHIIANPSRFVNRPGGGEGAEKARRPGKKAAAGFFPPRRLFRKIFRQLPPPGFSLSARCLYGRPPTAARAGPRWKKAEACRATPLPAPCTAGRPARRFYASGKAGCVRAAKRSCMGGEAPGPVCARPGGEGTATRRLPRRNRHRTRQGTCKSSKSSGCCPFCPGSAGRGISSVPPCGRTGRRWGR